VRETARLGVIVQPVIDDDEVCDPVGSIAPSDCCPADAAPAAPDSPAVRIDTTSVRIRGRIARA
jgi:hypothetical protein